MRSDFCPECWWLIFKPWQEKFCPNKNPWKWFLLCLSGRSRLVQPWRDWFLRSSCWRICWKVQSSHQKTKVLHLQTRPSQKRGYSSWKALCFSVVFFGGLDPDHESQILSADAPGSAEESEDDFFAGFRVALGSEKPQEKIGHAACWCQIILDWFWGIFKVADLSRTILFRKLSPIIWYQSGGNPNIGELAGFGGLDSGPQSTSPILPAKWDPHSNLFGGLAFFYKDESIFWAMGFFADFWVVECQRGFSERHPGISWFFFMVRTLKMAEHPGTQMTLVLGAWPSKINVIGVLGWYNSNISFYRPSQFYHFRIFPFLFQRHGSLSHTHTTCAESIFFCNSAMVPLGMVSLCEVFQRLLVVGNLQPSDKKVTNWITWWFILWMVQKSGVHHLGWC